MRIVFIVIAVAMLVGCTTEKYAAWQSRVMAVATSGGDANPAAAPAGTHMMLCALTGQPTSSGYRNCIYNCGSVSVMQGAPGGVCQAAANIAVPN